MTCTDNKRWILDDNVNTLAFGHYRLKDMYRRNCFYFLQLGLNRRSHRLPRQFSMAENGSMEIVAEKSRKWPNNSGRKFTYNTRQYITTSVRYYH